VVIPQPQARSYKKILRKKTPEKLTKPRYTPKVGRSTLLDAERGRRVWTGTRGGKGSKVRCVGASSTSRKKNCRVMRIERSKRRVPGTQKMSLFIWFT